MNPTQKQFSLNRAASRKQIPISFQSAWMDDGSRTIDCGQCFEISVNNDGFEVRRDSGPWPVSDLFGEMQYWPEHKVWTGSADTLDELLKQLGKQTGLSRLGLTRFDGHLGGGALRRKRT